MATWTPGTALKVPDSLLTDASGDHLTDATGTTLLVGNYFGGGDSSTAVSWQSEALTSASWQSGTDASSGSWTPGDEI